MNIHLLGFSSLFDPKKLGYKLQFEAFLLILSCESYSYSSFKLVKWSYYKKLFDNSFKQTGYIFFTTCKKL